ncbi:hypothetical protein K2173_018571 [Erythroxylum novogranatense]|uniref:Uncharacterized protein n=1 Tax=Erythroxylum novogranatense TaxID=1862640 RepID=A0AAV8UE83_9ROSI|nr:hypothetical protein K2173_018571 [Erythroxylum novogranatense]
MAKQSEGQISVVGGLSGDSLVKSKSTHLFFRLATTILDRRISLRPKLTLTVQVGNTKQVSFFSCFHTLHYSFCYRSLRTGLRF